MEPARQPAMGTCWTWRVCVTQTKKAHRGRLSQTGKNKASGNHTTPSACHKQCQAEGTNSYAAGSRPLAAQETNRIRMQQTQEAFSSTGNLSQTAQQNCQESRAPEPPACLAGRTKTKAHQTTYSTQAGSNRQPPRSKVSCAVRYAQGTTAAAGVQVRLKKVKGRG